MSLKNELEGELFLGLTSDCPRFTGNSLEHIKVRRGSTAGVILSAPNCTALYNKKGDVSGYRLTHKVNTRGLMHYAYLLNEFGSVNLKYFPRYKHWVNKSIYNTCVKFANSKKNIVVINKLPL